VGGGGGGRKGGEKVGGNGGREYWEAEAPSREGQAFQGEGGREVEILNTKKNELRKENTKYICRVAIVAEESQEGRSTPKTVQGNKIKIKIITTPHRALVPSSRNVPLSLPPSLPTCL
jgi:hypothetical protein